MPMEKTFNAAERKPASPSAGSTARPVAQARMPSPAACLFRDEPPAQRDGQPAYGPCFNNTLQEILVRWHRMQGHDTLWQPGTDHARHRHPNGDRA